MARTHRVVAAAALAALAVSLLAGCEGRPPRQPKINWKPATLETLKSAGLSPVMIVLTDGTEKQDRLVGTLLAHEPVEQAARGFVCMKTSINKADDPLVKQVQEWYKIDQTPALVFVRSDGIPGGLIKGGRTPAELVTQMMQVR
jgi:hypothetical protein